MPRRTAVLLLGLWLAATVPAVASHPKTDIVTLDKGDRFYGKIIHNLSVSLNVLDSYDSRPPTDKAAKNDLTVTSSLGYTF